MLVGGTISAAVASSFTLAVGFAWSVVCGELTQGRLMGTDGSLETAKVRELFTEQFGLWFQKERSGKRERSRSADRG